MSKLLLSLLTLLIFTSCSDNRSASPENTPIKIPIKQGTPTEADEIPDKLYDLVEIKEIALENYRLIVKRINRAINEEVNRQLLNINREPIPFNPDSQEFLVDNDCYMTRTKYGEITDFSKAKGESKKFIIEQYNKTKSRAPWYIGNPIFDEIDDFKNGFVIATGEDVTRFFIPLSLVIQRCQTPDGKSEFMLKNTPGRDNAVFGLIEIVERKSYYHNNKDDNTTAKRIYYRMHATPNYIIQRIKFAGFIDDKVEIKELNEIEPIKDHLIKEKILINLKGINIEEKVISFEKI